ncbi:MAG: hypothetical protein KC912_12315 [Proteobacteria bacterium]|nr:hypothetical protein [Pseudomonadota bacterium]
MRSALLLVLLGCNPVVPEDSSVDSEDTADTGGNTETGDTGPPGPVVPLAGFGTITGSCGELDDALDSSAPALLRGAIDFASKTYTVSSLTADGQEVIADGNLGGSSAESEAIAMEVLARCELATLIATETEIAYIDQGGKKTDLLVDAYSRGVGVSVTRAYHFPEGEPYTLTEAADLLQNKLGDVLLSSANAAPQSAWSRSVLSILAFDSQHADQIVSAWGSLDASVTDATIVIVTETHGADAFIY